MKRIMIKHIVFWNRDLGLLLLILTMFFGAIAEISAQKVLNDVLKNIHYRNVGPSKQGGRVIDLGIPNQKKQPFTYYLAFGVGGLVKTTDNFLTFKSVTDDTEILSIGDVAVSHSNPNTVWVGSGHFAYQGNGVFKSFDGGETWENVGLEKSYYITRIRIHPEDEDIVYVAVKGHEASNNDQRGLFKTTDGGANWTKILDLKDGDEYVGTADLVMHPNDPDILYASTWDLTGGEINVVYMTNDGGANWKKTSAGLPTKSKGRIGLDISLNNPDVLYALINGIGKDKDDRGENAVYRTIDGGEKWERMSPKEVHIKGYDRFGQIRVDPNDENHIYVLSTGVQTSDDAGKTWYRGIRFGGDNQALWINPENSQHMVMGYDYGMAVSHSGGKTWYHPDNLPYGQFYTISYDMDFPYNVYGGTQDFGTWKGPSTKRGRFPIRMEDWEHVGVADGGYVQVDPSDSRWLYVESQFGSISLNDQKTSVRRYIQYEKEDLRFGFVAPILLSPHNPNVVYHAANVVLKSDYKGEGWKIISPDLTNHDKSKENEEQGWHAPETSITTIDESPIEQGVIWVGTQDGNVQLTRDGGKTWNKLNDNIPGLKEYKVTRVEASNHQAGRAFVSVSGDNSHLDLTPYLYMTDDYGSTWTSIASSVPEDEPIYVVKEDHKNPDLLFIGTSKSVHVSLDRGKSWDRLRNNMPFVPVFDLDIHPRENDLIVGTYGRSIWICDISPLQELKAEVLQKEQHLFSIEPAVLWILPKQKQVGAATQNFKGENAPYGVVVNYYLKKKAKGKVSVQVFKGSRLINEYEGSGEQGLQTVQWYLTERIPRSAEQKRQYDKWVEEDEEEFFDYYDGHDHYGQADEEVSIYGRSLEIWIHPLKEWRERDYKHIRATPGTYTIRLMANGEVLEQKALVMKDHWYDRGL